MKKQFKKINALFMVWMPEKEECEDYERKQWIQADKALGEIENSHTELIKSLERLLNCPDLNLDELEPETLGALAQARHTLKDAK